MKKVLLLSTHDSRLGGHAWSMIEKYDKKKYDVKLVTLYSSINDKSYAIIHNYKLYKILNIIINRLSILYDFFQLNKNFSQNKYCYLRTSTFPITAEMILKKYNNGLPDIIVIHWFDGFVSPKTIRRLYEITKAKIVFDFTDEFALGGGCHYPCECEGYKESCKDCPALNKNKKIAEYKLKEKITNLSSIPKYVIAPTAGINKAKESRLFRSNTIFLTESEGVKLNKQYDRDKIRREFGIQTDDFVIMFGAMNINEERKGLKLLIASLEILAQNIDKVIIALVPGKISNEFKPIKNIKFKYIGFLSLDELCKVYTAADVYISPSIADSGPMMVKYSIACGTPVVAFPIGFAIDFVKHKETGYLAENLNVNDLANGILYFYQHKDNSSYYRHKCLDLNDKALKNDFQGNSL